MNFYEDDRLKVAENVPEGFQDEALTVKHGKSKASTTTNIAGHMQGMIEMFPDHWDREQEYQNSIKKHNENNW